MNAPHKEQLRVAERQVQQWAIQLIQLGETKAVAIENEDYMMAKKAKAEYEKIKMYCLSINTKTGAFIQNEDHQPSYQYKQQPDIQPSYEQNVPVVNKQRLTKHSEDAIIPALRQGKKPLTFEEQLQMFDEQIAKGLDPSINENL